MKKILVANWKMNPLSEGSALELAKHYDFSDVVIAPPFIFISRLRRVLKKASLGAQDVFFEKSGAYTGEISTGQLKLLGVSYVILGHSERRALGETDGLINKKLKAAIAAGLKVILCVGESWSVRRRGLGAAKKSVEKQLDIDLKGTKNKKNLIIAYEPVWAIGTGKNDVPADTVGMVKFIKSLVGAPVLYGGSVNAENIAEFMRYREIDGVLVGGASLRPAEFKKIVKLTRKY